MKIKPYFINSLNGGKTVEVNLYGEVVESAPTDWWTGEKIDGLPRRFRARQRKDTFSYTKKGGRLTTAIFACFGGEILSCALIKIFKLREGDDGGAA